MPRLFADVQPLQYAHRRLQQELENDSKDQWQHDIARDVGCRQQRKDEKATKEYAFGSEGSGSSSGSSAGARSAPDRQTRSTSSMSCVLTLLEILGNRWGLPHQADPIRIEDSRAGFMPAGLVASVPA